MTITELKDLKVGMVVRDEETLSALNGHRYWEIIRSGTELAFKVIGSVSSMGNSLGAVVPFSTVTDPIRLVLVPEGEVVLLRFAGKIL